MGLSNAEVKLRRLLASMPKQDNPRKLIHYLATARELLTVLTGEIAHQNLASISADKAREYGERIQAFADKLNSILSEPSATTTGGTAVLPSSGDSSSLRKRRLQVSSHPDDDEVKLDSDTHDFIGKHRRLQDDLTDEMVVLAQHMKESTLLMQQSLRDSEKVLDSTSDAVERSLASTHRVTRRAGELYSRGSLTGCYTWLLIFAMFCIFVFMIALIRVT